LSDRRAQIVRKGHRQFVGVEVLEAPHAESRRTHDFFSPRATSNETRATKQ
jgi:hypothetical protein